ncbi:Late embryogenesis abundant protein, partial [Mucuna pruriens]
MSNGVREEMNGALRRTVMRTKTNRHCAPSVSCLPFRIIFVYKYPLSINNTSKLHTAFLSLTHTHRVRFSFSLLLVWPPIRVAEGSPPWGSESPTGSGPPTLPHLLQLPGGRAAAYSSSVYDKNPDDQIHSGPVPDDVIEATQSGKYWAPHPQTGVFGPPGDQVAAASGTSGGFHSEATTGSVLEEKAWFRPTSLEDLEKPHTLP